MFVNVFKRGWKICICRRLNKLFAVWGKKGIISKCELSKPRINVRRSKIVNTALLPCRYANPDASVRKSCKTGLVISQEELLTALPAHL